MLTDQQKDQIEALARECYSARAMALHSGPSQWSHYEAASTASAEAFRIADTTH